MDQLYFQCRHRFPSGFELDIAFQTSGRVTALFGPSGVGKSTVLNIVAGLLHPNWGSVRLGTTTLLDTQSRIDLAVERRGIGLVFQDHLLFPHMNVRANLTFGRRRQRSHPSQIDFDELVSLLELDQLLDRQPHTLSGGQQQRVALGRAVLSEPRLLLMDEPLAAIDVELKQRILTYLKRIIDRWNVPAIFVSHDRADVAHLADQIVGFEMPGRLSRAMADS